MAITPFSKSFNDKAVASFSCVNSTAKNNPKPLTSFICFPFLPFVSKIFFKLSRNIFPSFAEFSQSLSSKITSIAALAVLAARGFPPKVDPCYPGWM